LRALYKEKRGQGKAIEWAEWHRSTRDPKDVERVRSCTNNQEGHHLGVDSAAELKRLLEEAGIEYDPRYFE